MYPSGKKGKLWQIKFGFMRRVHDGAVQIVDGNPMHGGMYVADWECCSEEVASGSGVSTCFDKVC